MGWQKIRSRHFCMHPRRISLSELGRRNVVYSDAEQAVIRNALKTSEAGLLRLDTLRSNGPARRRQLMDQIQRYNVALAPYKKVPKEIWIYIFELCCQSSRLSTCVTRRQPLVTITQVCSAWRQIAISMPKLWSDVHMGEDANLARIWLERAGNIPRALETIPSPHCSNSNRSPAIQSFLSSFPFRKLHLTQCDTAGIDFTAIPVESLLPLEDLALLKSAWNAPDLVIPFSPHNFPNLVSLCIDTRFMPRFHVSRPFATWKKLRVLRLECKELAIAQYLEILRDASSVEDCSLRLTRRFFYAQVSTIENTTVANMKIFRLSFPSTSLMWSLLDHLIFPNLHTLILMSRGSTRDFGPYDKSSLIRLAPRIESLRSLNFHLTYQDVDVGFLLECLPQLQVLELHCGKITTDTAEKIGRGEIGGCLRQLRDWSSKNLIGFLQACELRRDATKHQSPNSSGATESLEKVSVRYSKSSPSVVCKRRIRKLRKDGVRFEMFQDSR